MTLGGRVVLSALLVAVAACDDGRETVEIVVPFREGGGSDQWARALAPYLQKHLGDGSTVQVVNIPGASGLQGGNVFALRREPDGRSLFVSSGSNVFPRLLGEPAARYDFSTFRGIVGSPVGGVVYVASSLEVRTPADLCATDRLLIYGGVSPTGLDMVPLLSFDLLGLDVLEILGYSGKGAARVAFEQGETNLDYQTSPAYLANVVPLIEDGDAVPIFSFGMLDSSGRVVRDPVFPELPSLADAFRTCRGEEPSGLAWEVYKTVLVAGFAAQKNLWVHGATPDARVERLIGAAGAAVRDPAFLQSAERLLGGYEFYLGADVERALAATTTMSPAALEWLVSYLEREHDVVLPKRTE